MYNHSFFSKYFNLLFMVEVKPRRSPRYLRKVLIELSLTFCSSGPIVDTMKQLVRGNTQARQHGPGNVVVDHHDLNEDFEL